MIKTINDKLLVKKYKPAKISTLSLGKIDSHEYFTGEKILPSDQ